MYKKPSFSRVSQFDEIILKKCPVSRAFLSFLPKVNYLFFYWFIKISK
ncbi:hypothetical protein mhp081 [Mesomycoplasma hyopneumoniae 232]|uniref:Uncharacterized protein n=1 Tax=Mesomycoplasma hyopneumoniae (strain 232) TaxID=295358 RepID=Q601X0_MESH2|nr:hypothetical protein mhp081 [Mesomycoplasma hyopneumoniae 232]